MATWFLADTHYSHRNIVRGTSNWLDLSGCRNFDTSEQHNDWLVDLINRHVHRQDTLYHLGDWSFGGQDKIPEFRNRLNVERIHLVLGNHDHHQAQGKHAGLFESVSSYKELDIKGCPLVLCHYPIESWHGQENGVRHLHGHVHGAGRQLSGRYDVGVDALGLVSLDQVRQWALSTDQRHASIEGGSKLHA